MRERKKRKVDGTKSEKLRFIKSKISKPKEKYEYNFDSDLVWRMQLLMII